MDEHDHLRHLRHLAEDATALDEPRLRAAVLAELQRVSAWALRDAVSRVRADGVSWRELATDLGVPSATLHRQFESGRRIVVPDDGAERPAAPTSDGAPRPSDTVPMAGLNLFVGRDRELVDLRALLGRARAVSLVGPAGVGKTRLAAEFVQAARASFPAGVWWVDLAPLTPGSDVWPAVTAVVATGEHRGKAALDVLAGMCAARAGLLVLDNCEHLTRQCSSVIESLLVACSRLRVLVTSREELGMRGETLVPLAPLDVPVREDASWSEVPAVRLFANRASAANPDFVLTDENAALVAQMCRQLDGLPLAIELAASRVRLLGLAEIAALLRERFELLEAPSGGGTGRRGLWAAIDWSYQLLLPVEQAAFRRLAVFVGGFDIAGAKAICVDDSVEGGPSQAQVLSVLRSLQAKSLIATVESPRGRRLRLLESLRLYAWEQLEAAGELDRCVDRLATYLYGYVQHYLHRGEHAGEDPWDLPRAEAENAELAMGWAERREDPRHTGLAAIVSTAWCLRGAVTTAREVLSRALDADLGPAIDKGYALTFAAGVNEMIGQFDDAVRLAEEAVAHSRATATDAALTDALEILGKAYLGRGRFEDALPCFEEAVALARRLHGPYWTAVAQLALADALLYTGALDEAVAVLSEAEPVIRGDHDPIRLAKLLRVRGVVAVYRSELDTAEGALSESLDCLQGYSELAPLSVEQTLEALGVVAALRHQPARALRLAAAANRIRSELNREPDPGWRKTMLEAVATARNSATGADDVWAEGRSWTARQAVDYALDGMPVGARAGTGSPLTARQLQVAELVADGFTNDQIAARLGVTSSTIQDHLARIRATLDLPSRTHVVAWIVSQRSAPRS